MQSRHIRNWVAGWSHRDCAYIADRRFAFGFRAEQAVIVGMLINEYAHERAALRTNDQSAQDVREFGRIEGLRIGAHGRI